MKVGISYSVDVDDAFRRAINLHFGREGLATRDEVKRWFRANGGSGNDDLSWDLQQAIAGGDIEPEPPWAAIERVYGDD